MRSAERRLPGGVVQFAREAAAFLVLQVEKAGG